LKQGQAYDGGSLHEFERLTRLYSSQVLYAGDHVSADLLDPSERAMWKTVAIIKEISHEIYVMSTREFKTSLTKLLEIEALIDYAQRLTDDETKADAAELKKQRKVLRRSLLQMFNSHFGSVFRTSSHRTAYFFLMSRFADIYCSDISCFLNYPLNYCFYAKRSFFPHEPGVNELFEADDIDPTKAGWTVE